MKKQTSAATETRNKIREIISFAGKTIYIGIDVHKKDWQVAAYYEGIVLGNHRMKADAASLIEHLTRRYPDATLKCVYESSAWGFTLQRRLGQSGIDCIVVHAADVPGSNKEKVNKNDPNDALRLARHYAAGLIHGIHVPDEQIQKHRNLIRFRKRIVGDLGRSKNRLKSILKYQGIDIPIQYDNSSWSKKFLQWVEEQALADVELSDTLLLMLEQIKLLRGLLLKTERRLRERMHSDKYHHQADLLMSIPGVGSTTAMLFLLEIGDVRRFDCFDRLNSFVGFYPGSRSSGEAIVTTGIASRRHNQLRTMLVEAAWQLIKRDPAMLESYQELIKKMKGSEAIIRIARKLLRRMRAVLLSNQPYRMGLAAA